MGSGISSIPMQINKERFRQLAGGTFNDAIFDAHAVNGLLSREKLIELSQTSDCLMSFDDGTDVHGRSNRDRVSRINDYLRGRGLVTSFTNPADTRGVGSSIGNIVPQICSTVDKTRCVIFFITQNYMQRIGGSNVTEKNKIEFNYAVKKMHLGQFIPIVMEDPLKDSSRWGGPVAKALSGLGFLDFSSDENFDAKCNAIFERIVSIVRGSAPSESGVQTSGLELESHGAKEETQFFLWMARCTSIEESRRIVYCGTLVQAGIRNVNLLAQALKADPGFLIRIGFNEYDADAIAHAISDLGLGFTLSRDFSGATTVESAMYALRKTSQSPQDHVLCKNALACVVRIAESNPEHPKQMSDAGFCEAIVKLMQWHLGDGDSVEQGYRALEALAKHSEEIRDVISLSGFSTIVSRAMLSHLDKPRLIEAGCKCVGVIAFNRTNRGMLGLAGACETIPNAAIRHVSDHGVAEQFCFAMEQMQIENFENTGKLAEAGGNRCIAQALAHHPTSPSVAFYAFKAICLLCRDPENRNELGLTAIQPMVTSMRTHIENPGIAQAGCSAMAALVVANAFNRENLGKSGACETVKAAIETHKSNMGVIFHGSVAVWSLANGSPQFIPRFKGLQPLLQALLAHPQVPPEVKSQLNEALLRIR